MFKILRKKELNPSVTLMDIEAPLIAKKAKAGQFIIFRIDEEGERIPLTIADTDKERGAVTIIFQKVGLSTELLAKKNEGEYILDFVGPLGAPTELDGLKKVAVVGGGVGCAIAFPQAKTLFTDGREVDVITGFRTKDRIFPLMNRKLSGHRQNQSVMFLLSCKMCPHIPAVCHSPVEYLFLPASNHHYTRSELRSRDSGQV